MRRVLACAAVALAWAGAASAAEDAPAPPSFAKDVKPFLSSYCMNCHNAARARAGVSVETFADLTAPGRRGMLVAAGKPDDSRLLAVLTGRGRHMPPGRSPQPNGDEIAKVRDWIKAGAVDDTQPAAPGDADKKTPADTARP
jgi:hypothetical protein